jgi:uncharacterized protein (DUF1684 family)
MRLAPAATALVVGFLLGAAESCSRQPHLHPLSGKDSIAIVNENLAHRAEADSFFRMDPASPFRNDTTIVYHGLRWFPVDPRFRVTSELHPLAAPETVTVYGTRGEPRQQVRCGYFEFALPDADGRARLFRLNAYKFTSSDSSRTARFRENLCVWFTDRTTCTETYQVGRYLDVGDDLHDPSHLYVIDLNAAYNPYCAYSALFSCAIATGVS